ncbi:MAG: ABC transporter ATP-binding protein [Burkholderiaceae bacterium]
MPLLQLNGITKRYPSVVANDAVSLTLEPGEIHAVLGENGAGKSTLMKIIYGLVQPDSGHIVYQGETLTHHHPHQARAQGIAMVFQHFSLFDTLTVAHNVWLGLDSKVPLSDTRARIVQIASDYGLDIDPDRPVHTLSVGEKQRVEIIRALLGQPRLLILDEPTSVLTPQAVEKLFVVLRRLADQGCSILYISHKLHEIQALCHRCTVMRAGRVVGVCDPRHETPASLSRLMMGQEPPALVHRALTPGPVRLSVEGLSLPSDDPFGVALEQVHLEVRHGEIVGIAGVSGNGQRELMAALSGEDARAEPRQVCIDGVAVGHLGPRQRRRLGLYSVPEERLGRGAVPEHSLALNLLLTRNMGLSTGGWLRLSSLQRVAQDLIDRYQIKASGPQALAKSLSGGNLQKVIVGREMEAQPKLLLVSQPTWGVDVGAAAQIRASLLALRDQGCAVLVVSDELDELFELCDRLVVMSQGRLSPSLDRAGASTEQIGAWMSGLWTEASATPTHPPLA